MLDIKFIRENAELIKKTCINKNISCDIDHLLKIDEERRSLVKEIDDLRAKQNQANQKVAKSNFQEKASAIQGLKVISENIKLLDKKYKLIDEEHKSLLLSVPQPPLENVPIGKNENSNIKTKTFGDIPNFSFKPKSHIELGKNLDILDIERAVKIAGARNYILKNEGALLMEAVMKFAVDMLMNKGYDYMTVPHLVREDAMIGTGYFPFGKEDAYELSNDNSYLIGTAEVVLTSYHSKETLDEKDLPIRLCGKSDCYRREAGTYGKDTAGVYRVHQFTKVEQVILCKDTPEESAKYHKELLENAEQFMQALKLPYRVMELCTGDMGAGQVKKHDIETWMPSRNSYGETHSCSSFYDFQSRRLGIKYKSSEGKKYDYTLNNTMVASPRILIAIIENYQNEDGTVRIPDVLQRYMHHTEVLKPKK